MKYCSNCGASVSLKIPEGDNLHRHVCDACASVFYQNPKIVAGCIVEWETRILLCKRAIEPRRGFWTLPAGFMENGETCAQAAAREAMEEAEARVEIGQLFTLINVPHISQVHMMFRATPRDLNIGPGIESTEVGWFEEHQIPWPELAFPTIKETLKRYYADRLAGNFGVHVTDIVRREV